MNRRAQAGFTLIELMVVVAIIGLLSAVAIPNFMKQQRKAKGTQRTMQTTQIEKAAKRYFDEKLAWPTVVGAASTLSSTWNPVTITPTSEFDPNAVGWKVLEVPVESRSRFQHQLTGSSTLGGVTTFSITSRADLDGNGVFAVTTRTWTLTRQNWNVIEVVSGDTSE